MSGQQIGTVIGGAIGAYFGGPAGAQLGMAIGGAIGGAVDPTHINGPKIGDGQQQAATDGNPIAWVQGSAMVAGTIVQVSSRRQIRHKDDGKGGGTVAVTFTAVQDFAILVCESSELRDSTMSSVLMVMQDGKLVYDVRPGSTMLADSYKWKANVDFLYGDEEQLPHPTLEAITGVGNTPAYRGSCIAVFKNFDVSQAGDRIPTFQFVVASSGSPAVDLPYNDPSWKYHVSVQPPGDLTDYSGVDFDDSSWPMGPGGFGNLSVPPATVGTAITDDAQYKTIWMRHSFQAANVDATVTVYFDNYFSLYINGELVYTNEFIVGEGALVFTVPPAKLRGNNVIAVKVGEALAPYAGNRLFGAVSVTAPACPIGVTDLSAVIGRICSRGGLAPSDVERVDMYGTPVAGYPIARQANAADCLLPLLQAYFGYASEYDAQLHFRFYGDDAEVTIDRADLIEGNDANDGAITSNLRNQSTEFPRRIVASYMDPAQNYTVVTVARERLATDVIAIGDQAFQVPVVMSAGDATKAADKALKVAYATLEGTQDYSTTFAGSDVYLQIAAGEPVIFQGKRWVTDGVILGNGSLKLTTRYDRQSAYTSNVQPILGNAPTTPASPYSGPTTLYPMDLPAQRPQDSVGVYLVAASTDGRDSWRGCNVQVSYDGMETWQNALQINMEGTIGTVALNEPTGGEPLTIDVVKFDLDNATPAQLAALANAFAVISVDDMTQLGQFATATETSTDNRYELTGISRSLGGTAATPVVAGDRFTLMDAAYFLPIDPSFAGRTLYFRGVGYGEIAEDAEIFSLVYTALIAADSAPFITEDGVYEFTTETGTLAISTE